MISSGPRFPIVRTIARKEFVASWREKAFPALAAGVALLVVAIGVVGWANYSKARARRADAQAIVRDQWFNQPDRHPHRASHYGYFAFHPKPLLSFFDFGLDSYAGASIYLEPHRQNSANFSEASQSTAMLRFGELSAAMALQLLVPLVVFFLGFSSVTKERENGTLSILLSQGVSLEEIALGKILGLCASVALLAIPVALIPGTLLLARVGAQGWLDTAMRASILSLGYALYFGTCAASAVLVSAAHGSSKGALTTLLGVWIGLCVVAPRALARLGESLHPAPSRIEFDMRLEELVHKEGDSHNPNDPHFAALKRSYLERYNVKRVEDLPVNFGGVVMEAGEDVTSALFNERFADLETTYRKQNRVTEMAGLLDPYLAIRGLSMALSGTDFHHFMDFQKEAERYRHGMIQGLNEIHAKEIKYENDRAQRVSSSHWQAFSPFAYRQPGIGWALSHQIVASLSLASWPLMLIGATLRLSRVAGNAQ